MSKIEGKAKRYDGSPVDYVLLFDWLTGDRIGKSVPDAAGNWQYEHFTNLNCGITYVADGCEPITHGAYQFISNNTDSDNVGQQGSIGFGVGFTNTLPTGLAEMEGTRVLGHANYGNYQHTDGSIMVYVPMFYYRWGGTNSPYVVKYGANSLDIKDRYAFTGVEDANANGYAVHRAFYDNGQLKNGFFVDKYLCSNNSGTASSIKNGRPLSTASVNAPISALTGSPANNFAGAIGAVKTRGPNFFVTTLFVQRALSMLSMAQAQAATSIDACAWYDANDVINFPKGCNNNNLGDANDATVSYEPTGYTKSVKTGSANQLAKTTHNGQLCGVADLNGVMYEISLGITQDSGTFYALKTSVKASSLTGGVSSPNDAWGASGINSNYDALGSNIGALTGAGRTVKLGNSSNRVFSNALSGADWQASCAGIPLANGVSTVGTNIFGSDVFYDARVEGLCISTGGAWSLGAINGVWHTNTYTDRSSSSDSAGFRAALYA